MEQDARDDKMGSVDIGKFKLKFGKHKGKTFAECDKAYLKWTLDENIFENDEFKWNKYIRNYIAKL